MCACSDKIEDVPFYLVYEQPVRFDMAFPLPCPFPMQCVVVIGFWKFFFLCKHRDDFMQFDQRFTPLLDMFVVFLERR